MEYFIALTPSLMADGLDDDDVVEVAAGAGVCSPLGSSKICACLSSGGASTSAVAAAL